MSCKLKIIFISGRDITLEISRSQLETIMNLVNKKEDLDLTLNSMRLYVVSDKIEHLEFIQPNTDHTTLYTVEIPTFCESGSKYVLHRMYSGRICLTHCNFAGENWKDLDQYKLTEEEIKRDHEYLWELAEKCEDNS